MLGYLPTIILQTIGVIIPIIGIIVLMKKGEGKSNSLLIMANFGALIMNWGYMQILKSSDYQEAISIYKFEYVGTVVFYIFFVLFLRDYFMKKKRSKIISVALLIFFVIEIGTLGIVYFNSDLAYDQITVQYRQDDGKFYDRSLDKDMAVDASTSTDTTSEDSTDTTSEDSTDTAVSGEITLPEKTAPDSETVTDGTDSKLLTIGEDDDVNLSDSKGYILMSITQGKAFIVRYSYLALILAISLVASFVKAFKKKAFDEKRKLFYVVGAEVVILLSLLYSLLVNYSYDVVPLLGSASILFIICGTANGNFFTIADRGRGWVIDHSDNIFIIVTEDYRFIDANEYARKIFPILAKTPQMMLIPEEIRNCFKHENEEFEFEGHIYATKMAPINIPRIYSKRKNKIVGYSILMVDITAQHKLMEELEAERQKAIEANEAKSNFMSNMSHEIRTPMNAIVGMTEIMLRHEQDSFNEEYLNNIKNSGQALLTVINDILDFSKIESGKLEIIPEEYEIMSVLNDLSMIFLNRIGEKPLEMIYDIDPKMPHKLYGDSGRIRQVLLNIVNNGIKYSDEGYVKLTIRYEKGEGNKATLFCEVKDTGMGIKEEDMSKLFSNFSQVDTKKNRGKEGTGLGLSIAKQLVESMGGSISVESVYGEGSAFKFTMEQEVVDETPAAYIKTEKDIYVSACMNAEISLNNVKKLCGYYDNVHFVELEEVRDGRAHADYVFADKGAMCQHEITEDDIRRIKEEHIEVIGLHNPMLEDCDSEFATMMNKPIYTLNFCLAINHEVLSFKEQQEQLMSFKAPSAKILLVDDNEMNRKVAAGLMEPIEMQIDMAVDGKQAVEKVMQGRYDIVFMDHMMPVMDGIEATKAIREMGGDYYSTVPIIALSANALAEAKQQFKDVGMDDFLAKPIKTKKLFKLILKYLPEEKVVKCEGGIEAPEIKEDELPVIEGLDVKAGVENSGGLKLFTSLLGDFYKLIDRKTTKLEKCLADNMIRDYTIEVHALKNTARMIGALELSDMFYELEKAGNASDMDTINSLNDRTLELYQSYKQILAPYAAGDNEEKTDISKEAIIDALTKLKDCMDVFDLDGADEAMKILENSKMPEAIREKVDDLGALVADVAMEDVMNLCEQIIKDIQ